MCIFFNLIRGVFSTYKIKNKKTIKITNLTKNFYKFVYLKKKKKKIQTLAKIFLRFFYNSMSGKVYHCSFMYQKIWSTALIPRWSFCVSFLNFLKKLKNFFCYEIFLNVIWNLFYANFILLIKLYKINLQHDLAYFFLNSFKQEIQIFGLFLRKIKSIPKQFLFKFFFSQKISTSFICTYVCFSQTTYICTKHVIKLPTDSFLKNLVKNFIIVSNVTATTRSQNGFIKFLEILFELNFYNCKFSKKHILPQATELDNFHKKKVHYLKKFIDFQKKLHQNVFVFSENFVFYWLNLRANFLNFNFFFIIKTNLMFTRFAPEYFYYTVAN